jgi:hypothetical protein
VTTDPNDIIAARKVAAKRKRKSHAALGSRVIVSGVAISGTLGLAGVMAAAAPSYVAAAKPARLREVLMTTDTLPAHKRPTKALAAHAKKKAAGGTVPPTSAAKAGLSSVPSTGSGAVASGYVSTPTAPVATAPVATAPGSTAAPVTAPPVTAPPVTAPPVTSPPTSPPVVTPPTAPPTTVSSASPPPP